MTARTMTATIATAGALLAASLGLVAPSAGSSADGKQRFKGKEFEGRVLKVNREAGVFVQSVRHRHHKWHTRHGWDKYHENRGKHRVRIKVTDNTRYDDLAGFGALRRGMKVETTARPVWNKNVRNQKRWGKRPHTWVALKIERD